MSVTSGTVAPAFMAEIGARVDARLTAVLGADQDRWSAVDPDLVAPLESLQRLLRAGGKRLRPAFCFWAFVGVGGDPDDPRVVDAGAALELLHTFAVIHDDVMDDGARRHGEETIHTQFARIHTEAGWRGEHRRFGEGIAILVGDLAFVYSDILLRGAPPEAWEVFDQLRLEVNVGQYLDLLGTARARAGSSEQGPALARRICCYKSAKYTIERPLHLGVALCAPERLRQLAPAFSDYGLPLGEAFQLRDDVLGTFGDPEVTGKAVGEDLREGKPTLLYALARQRARGDAADLLAQRFGAADLSDGEVAAIQTVFEDTGARIEVEATIERLVDECLGAAANDRLPVSDEAREALIGLARFVAGRNY
jgi:geranylgeranyl diphosphate synthase, type I